MLKQAGISLISASLLLAGCGGGSSSTSDNGLTYDGPTAAVVISDQTTADGVAGTVIGMESDGSTTFSDATGIIMGVSTNADSNSTVNLSELGNMAKSFANRAFNNDGGLNNLLAGVTNTQTKQCATYNGSTGSATITLDLTLDQNDNWVPTIGDSFSMTFSSCYDDLSQELVNGNVSMTLSAISTLDPVTGDPTEFAASFVFSNLKATDTTTSDYSWLEGGFTAGFSSGDGVTTSMVFSVSGNSMIVEDKTAGVTQKVRLTNFSFVDKLGVDGSFIIDHDYTVACTQLGGSVTVAMDPAFIIDAGANNPSSGVVVVTGANDAKIRLTAQSDATNVFIEYDIVPVDGIYEASATVTWDSL